MPWDDELERLTQYVHQAFGEQAHALHKGDALTRLCLDGAPAGEHLLQLLPVHLHPLSLEVLRGVASRVADAVQTSLRNRAAFTGARDRSAR